jgi:hypothetical protein
MRTVALFALVCFLAACGKEEAHDHDHSSDKAPVKTVDQTADKAPAMTDAAPETGGEMRTITLAIEGMS